MLSLLTECTVQMLKIIHEMYREQRITYEEFNDLTKVKIKFLSDNINTVSYLDRITVNEILDLCTDLLNQNRNKHVVNAYCASVGMLQ
jgi:hypothetical protein